MSQRVLPFDRSHHSLLVLENAVRHLRLNLSLRSLRHEHPWPNTHPTHSQERPQHHIDARWSRRRCPSGDTLSTRKAKFPQNAEKTSRSTRDTHAPESHSKWPTVWLGAPTTALRAI